MKIRISLIAMIFLSVSASLADELWNDQTPNLEDSEPPAAFIERDIVMPSKIESPCEGATDGCFTEPEESPQSSDQAPLNVRARSLASS